MTCLLCSKSIQHLSHIRRYKIKDFISLAHDSGFEMIDARYFMFLLSPLYLFARMGRRVDKLSFDEKKDLVKRQHEIPHHIVNKFLTKAFELETPLSRYLRFPWGTSILGVFQKK